MNWLKNNINIVLLVAVVLLIVGIGVKTLADERNIQEITIEAGDTLWTLSQKYHGTMSQSKWLHQVKVDNNINGSLIVAGKTLWIPVTDNKNTTKLEIASDQ